MKFAKLLIFLSACALLTGCNKAGNTTTITTTTNAAAPKASVAPSKPPIETVTSGEKVSEPEDAAQGLYDAWKSRNREAAAKFATDGAIMSLYTESDHVGLMFQGCDKQGGDYKCSYSYEEGTLMMLVNGNALDGYKVTETSFTAN